MTNQIISFTGNKVALIVRGKTDDDHSPGLMEQHADCACSDGAPVGFFGGEGGGSSGNSGFISSAVLIGISGEVYNIEDFEINRSHYVDATKDRGAGVVSTVLIVSVANGEADRFDEYWTNLRADPGTFRLLGKNCSTRASGAFRNAEILSGGIHGLDTPNNLYKQLMKERPDRCTTYSGYVGFNITASNKYSLTIGQV